MRSHGRKHMPAGEARIAAILASNRRPKRFTAEFWIAVILCIALVAMAVVGIMLR